MNRTIILLASLTLALSVNARDFDQMDWSDGFKQGYRSTFKAETGRNKRPPRAGKQPYPSRTDPGSSYERGYLQGMERAMQDAASNPSGY